MLLLVVDAETDDAREFRRNPLLEPDGDGFVEPFDPRGLDG